MLNGRALLPSPRCRYSLIRSKFLRQCYVKILYLHQYFHSPSMVGSTRSYEMAKRLVSAGHEVHVVTSWRGTSAPSQKGWFTEVIDGIHVHWLPVPYSNKMKFWERLLAFFRFALSAGKQAIREGGDIVFATSTPLTIAIPAVRCAKALRIPLVFEVRDLWPEMPIAIGALKNPIAIWLARRLERYAYQNSEKVIALSPGMKRGVEQQGYPGENVLMIPNSADLDRFAPGNAAPAEFLAERPELVGRPIALYAGTLGTVNGVGYLADVASFARQKGSDICFVIVGDGNDENAVRSRATELGVLNANLFMYDSISKSEIASAFSAATVVFSVFIDLPEMRSNSANKFFDGLAAGKPIAINYGGWHADLIDQEGIGINLGTEPREAANKLIEAVGSADLLNQMGANSLSLAKREFSRDKLALQLEAVLSGCVKHR